MTPDDFPTREKYLAYVRECENSIIYTHSSGRYDRFDFDSATEPVPPGDHWRECTDEDEPYCWCRGDDDGLIEYYTRGMVTAAHVTSPMFTFKVDHNYGEEHCGWCRPEEFYWDDEGNPVSRKRAEEMWWKDYYESVRYSCSEYIGVDQLLPTPDPDKIGPHP